MGTLHRLIETLAEALAALRAGSPLRAPEDAALERMALVIHEAMSQPQRSYHGVDHALAVARGDDPIERLAGLFHDVVYLQIDRGVSPMIREILGSLAVPVPGTPAERRCLGLFGADHWSEIPADKGLNESMSALVATRLLEPVVSPQALLGIQGAIEATIPFRGDESLKALRLRLLEQDALSDLRVGEGKIEQFVRNAARLANRDVESFAAASTADFLGSTWLLFSELDPTLNRGRCYNVRTFRRALHAMERFLSTRIDARSIFISASDGDKKQVDGLRLSARQNLAAAVIYMRVKLFPIALVEAIAECTGGDAPLEMFLGDPRDPESVASWAVRSLDQTAARHVATHAHYEAAVDAEIFQLLWIGRSGSLGFDLPNSPLAALLYSEHGGPYLVDKYEEALAFFEGRMTAMAFLQAQTPRVLMPLAERIAAIAPTRRTATAHLLRTLRRVA